MLMLQFYFNNHIWLIQSLKSFKKMVNLFSIHHWNLLLLLEPSLMMWNGRMSSFSSFIQIEVTIREIFMKAIATRIHVACGLSCIQIVFTTKYSSIAPCISFMLITIYLPTLNNTRSNKWQNENHSRAKDK